MSRLPKPKVFVPLAPRDNPERIYYSKCAECNLRVRNLAKHFQEDHPYDPEYTPPPPSDLLKRPFDWPSNEDEKWPSNEDGKQPYDGYQFILDSV